MFPIIRDSRSYSSTEDSITARYSSGARGRDSATWASPSRLLIGVRRSCARSDENADSRWNDICSRSSMWLNATVDSTSSVGVSASDSRSPSASAPMRPDAAPSRRAPATMRPAITVPSTTASTTAATIAQSMFCRSRRTSAIDDVWTASATITDDGLSVVLPGNATRPTSVR